MSEAAGIGGPRGRVRIAVRGTVQGVGFRPFVWREAQARGLAGFVANTTEGVTIEAEGTAGAIDGLLGALNSPPPPASVIDVVSEAIGPVGEAGFAIRTSMLSGPRSASILPDLATCEECLAETRDPANRRHRYPFTNCTHCGPRYSIIEGLPYDRARTTMRRFAMCDACRAEYENPADRRFHAEPNACPACGPQLALWDGAGRPVATHDDALRGAAAALAEGRIVAVKGLGGFHLMADAGNEAAVRALRQRKQREEKPFAVMFASPAAVRKATEISDAEAAVLSGRARPIVLVRGLGTLAEAVAPGNPLIGAMLPYTPLHHLLLEETSFPLIATSGNRSDEPISIDETEALARLGGIADLFLVHDRPIVRPVDDSVVRLVAGRPTMLRRARGYAPAMVTRGAAPGILAVGGHLKTTVALSTGAGVVLSQHLGDLDTAEARDTYGRALADMQRLHDAKPSRVAHDRHPDYHTTRVAAGLGIPALAVQHHVAHVVACMAEHGVEPPVLGVAFDGTGYGPDGTVWGGEFIRVTGDGWRRVAHLRPFQLPGGEAAVREPRRSALGLLHAAFGAPALAMTDLAPVAAFTAAERTTLAVMLDRGLNAPVTTSAGRLFDAVASLAGLRQRAAYEGQAAMELEWAAMERAFSSPRRKPGSRPASQETAASIMDSGLCRNDEGERGYAFAIPADRADAPLVLDWMPALEAVLADVRAGTTPGAISAAFHAGLALAIAEVAARIGEATVVLSGGCFQNARLTEATIAALRAAGMTPVWHETVPPNDGGLALGQAWWAARHAGGA